MLWNTKIGKSSRNEIIKLYLEPCLVVLIMISKFTLFELDGWNIFNNKVYIIHKTIHGLNPTKFHDVSFYKKKKDFFLFNYF